MKYIIVGSMKFEIQHSEGARKKILDFLRFHDLASLATTNYNGHPENAVVEFGLKDDLSVIIATRQTFRKCQNMIRQPRVALVFGGNDGRTVQYEGEAALLDENTFYTELSDGLIHDRKNQFIGNQNLAYFKIKPRWIHYLNITIEPWEQFEVRFES